jgi:DNA-binding transcriptional ArsR family regulator
MPPDAAARAWREVGSVFAALGEATRLRIVERLCDEGPLSATRLADDAAVSRQALAKHLRVLAVAKVVSGARAGREVLFSLEPARLELARRRLDDLSREWDVRLARLRALVESPERATDGGGARRGPPAPRKRPAAPPPRR